MRKWMSLVVAVLLSACGPEQEPEKPFGLNSAKAYVCTGKVLFPDGGTITVLHNVWTFPDASLLVSCMMLYGDAQYGTTLMYRSRDPGAATAECAIRDNTVGDKSPGVYLFRMFSGRTASTVVYTDADVPGGSITTTISCTQGP